MNTISLFIPTISTVYEAPVDLTLDAVFCERIGRTQKQLALYENLYELPRLQYLQHTSLESYEHIAKKHHFILLVLYTDDGKIYMHNDGTGRALPGGSMYATEDFTDAISRITKHISPLLRLTHIEPILLMNNTFCHKHKTHTQHGIVYMARIPKKEMFLPAHHGDCLTLNDDFIQSVQKYGNKDILLYVQNNIISTRFPLQAEELQDEEIDTNVAMKTRYIIHRTVMKPLLSFLGINKNYSIKKRIQDECKDAMRIIDVSAGDDTLVQILAKNNPNATIVANDISWSQLESMNIGCDNILCTNHDAAKLPYKKQTFDIAICKNTLHHTTTRNQLVSLMQTLGRIAEKIIIVEIEDPRMKAGIAKLLHTYRYSGFLKDTGHAYLSSEQTYALLNHVLGQTHTIRHGVHHTPQGNYFWAVLTTHDIE